MRKEMNMITSMNDGARKITDALFGGVCILNENYAKSALSDHLT
jgi:hypothetical protein